MARIKEIQVSFGVTIELNGTYYKPNASIGIELEEQDKGKETRDKIFSYAWDILSEQIEKQLKEIEGV